VHQHDRQQDQPQQRRGGQQRPRRRGPAQRDEPAADHRGRRDAGERGRRAGVGHPRRPVAEQPGEQRETQHQLTQGGQRQQRPGEHLLTGQVRGSREDARAHHRRTGSRGHPAQLSHARILPSGPAV
jgi:hypothetical protein